MDQGREGLEGWKRWTEDQNKLTGASASPIAPRNDNTECPGHRLRRLPLGCPPAFRCWRGAATFLQLRLQKHRTPPPPRPTAIDAKTGRVMGG